VSAATKQPDVGLERVMNRPLNEEYPCLILDARHERVRENGVVRSRAVLVAIGEDWEGRRQVPGVQLANREGASSWREFLIGLKQRVLTGVCLTVTDQNEVLKQAVAEVLPLNLWQRCCVHFLRNALDYAPRSADPGPPEGTPSNPHISVRGRDPCYLPTLVMRGFLTSTNAGNRPGRNTNTSEAGRLSVKRQGNSARPKNIMVKFSMFST
jgi:hypothetical protein